MAEFGDWWVLESPLTTITDGDSISFFLMESFPMLVREDSQGERCTMHMSRRLSQGPVV